jgi:hypothetical protein
MNRIEYNSQDEGDNSDSEIEELFAKKTELRQKRGPNKVKELQTENKIIPEVPEAKASHLPITPTKKERSEAQKQATAKMREKLKVRHDEVQKLRIESQEIVKLQHKENSLNIKKKLFKDNVNEQIELRVQERLNEIRLKQEAEDIAKVKPKRIRAKPKPKEIKPEIKPETPRAITPPPKAPQRILQTHKALSFF